MRSLKDPLPSLANPNQAIIESSCHANMNLIIILRQKICDVLWVEYPLEPQHSEKVLTS